MSKIIQFVSDFEDFSTENGFQWEFRCDRCGKGFRTEFDRFDTGDMTSATGALDAIPVIDEHIAESEWEKEHEKAYERAVKSVRKNFMQCPECQSWVCKSTCWDDNLVVCAKCGSIAGVVRRESGKGGKATGGAQAACPACGEPVDPDDKYCAECGAQLGARRFCPNCGEQLRPLDKFCPECGDKIR